MGSGATADAARVLERAQARTRAISSRIVVESGSASVTARSRCAGARSYPTANAS
jgi:hypothetical protein